MKKQLKTYFGLFILFFSVVACSSGGDSNATGGSISISGKIVNENNTPLAGVEVKSGNSIATTSAAGEFVLTNVTAQARIVVNAKAAGYFTAYRAINMEGSNDQFLSIMMESKGSPINFSSSAGGSLTNLNGSVTLAPNSVMDENGNAYDGMVKAYLRFHTTDQANFSRIMQGGDFAGQNASGENGVLSSYGFFSIEMEDPSGNALNVKTGTTASFSQPIASNQVASSPNSVKLWSFDNELGKWKEEGTATKSGNKYVGQVSHFSAWNCDDWGTTATIKGKLECNGEPLVNNQVILNNESNQLIANTDSAGNFIFIIPSGFPVEVIIQGIDPINIAPLTTNEVYNLGSLTPSSCFGSLQDVLMSGTWVGDSCFDQGYLDRLTADESIFTFSTNKIFWEGTVIPENPDFESTYQIQGNEIVVNYRFDEPSPHNCFMKMRVLSYTPNLITFYPPLSSDYHSCFPSTGLTCNPKLTKQ
ncbi:MAG: hypothetical protein ACOVKJ_01350 [Flavobacterium sp.]|jgi:hypothetical protein